MGKLGSYSRQNSLATALREMGRIEKTIFILNYILDESLRRKIQKGLNKGEAMNGLARAGESCLIRFFKATKTFLTLLKTGDSSGK